MTRTARQRRDDQPAPALNSWDREDLERVRRILAEHEHEAARAQSGRSRRWHARKVTNLRKLERRILARAAYRATMQPVRGA